MEVVVCGGGVVGAALAYYLNRAGARVTVLEGAGVAAAASGNAGGFLAEDWCDGSPMASLARTSFGLHRQLAKDLEREFGVNYGYRPMDTYMVVGADAGDVTPYGREPNPGWLDGNCVIHRTLGDPRTTAQVHPEQFTRSLMDAATARGARLINATVETIEAMEAGGRPRVKASGHWIEGDAVVVAMGPWSALAAHWLPLPPPIPRVDGLKGLSVRLKPSRPVPAHALFVEFLPQDGEHSALEIYPRPDGEVYICGDADGQPLPVDPTEITVPDADCESLRSRAARLASVLRDAELVGRQACYRPICQDGLPLIGPIAEAPGLYVATGHNCWGILNAPASGKALAELITQHNSQTVDLAPFAPHRGLNGGTSSYRGDL